MKKSIYVIGVFAFFLFKDCLPRYFKKSDANVLPSQQKRFASNEKVFVNQETFAEFDEFDELINSAIKKNIIDPNVDFPAPTKFQKLLVPFVNFYCFIISKFRGIKGWIKKKFSPVKNS